MDKFAFFVLPFCVGVVLLGVFSVWKYARWIRSFDKMQRTLIRKNIWSFRFLPALWEMVRESLLHWRITKHHVVLGYMHRSLAFGWFLLIVVGAGQAIAAFPKGHPLWMGIFFNYFEGQGVVPEFRMAHWYAQVMDILLLYVLSGLLLAMLKRLWSRPIGMKRTTKHNLIDRITKFALWCIFPLRLLAEGATSALYHNGGFLVQGLGYVMEAVWLRHEYFEYTLWVLYSVALGTFFSLMPFSRYMHIFTEPLLIFFRDLGLRERTDRATGYTKFELSACSRCGICIDGCPMNRELGITDMQGVYLLRSIRGKDIRKNLEQIADNCLMCDRCVNDCPVAIDLNTIRRQVRIANKEGFDTSGNYEYTKTVQGFNAIGRVAYFGGCMSKLTPGVAVAMEKIFDAAGQKYWHVDKEKGICCGRPLLQQGFDQQATELRRRNSELIASSGATMLITSCPICYRSFKEEYHLGIPVFHHTEYIDYLMKSGRLKVRKTDQRVTYHDPCELGRGCGIYDEPRAVLSATTTLLKTQEEREHSLCCGHNLGNLHLSGEEHTAVRDASMENLLAPNPDLIATACPMCKKAFTRAQTFPVKDIAEIVAENIIS